MDLDNRRAMLENVMAKKMMEDDKMMQEKMDLMKKYGEASTATPSGSEVGSEAASVAVSARSSHKEKHLSENFNLGAKLLPGWGDLGVHLLQALMDEAVRKRIFQEIVENKDEKTPLLKMLDEVVEGKNPAAQVGYAKMMLVYVTELKKDIHKTPQEGVLKIAFLALLSPLVKREADLEKLAQAIVCIFENFHNVRAI